MANIDTIRVIFFQPSLFVLMEEVETWFAELRQPLDIPDCEPDIDDKDKAKDKELREIDAVNSGLVRKHVLRASASEVVPEDGGLVYIHYSVATVSGDIVQSTRLEEGGDGLPLAFVIGGGCRVPRGWEIALLDARVGEVFQLVLHPKFGYGHTECQLSRPSGLPAGEETLFLIQLMQCYPKADITVLPEHGGILKRSVKRGAVWESPRSPFEVTVGVRARLPAPDASLGRTYFETPADNPLQFTMGSSAVPPAVQSGLQSMCRGDTAVLTCQREAACASASADNASAADALLPLPPSSAATVELELTLHSMIQVRDMTGDGKVVKRRIRDGRGEFPVDCPVEDSTVRVHYRVLDVESGHALLDTREGNDATPPLEFQTGMASLPEGLDMAVRLMTPGELASVRAEALYAYDGRHDRPQGLAEGAAVVWEVELFTFDRTAHATRLSGRELLQRGLQLKTQGNIVFKQGMNRHAEAKWLKALKMLNQVFDLGNDDDLTRDVASGKASICVNLALAAQHRDEFSEALKWANKALKEAPNHPKALYRRASVHAVLNNHQEAHQDFRRVAEIDPALKAEVEREIARMNAKAAASDRRQAKQWRGSIR